MRVRLAAASIAFAFLAGATLHATASGAAAANPSESAVGAWWRTLPSAAGPPAVQVWELRPDGVFVTFGPDALQDRGRYRIGAGTIHVESEINPALRGDIGYRLSGHGEMTLTLGPPLNQTQHWKRARWGSNFRLATVGAHSVPINVDRMVKLMVAETRKGWRDDAVPERLEFETMKNRDMRATLDVCAPSDGACKRLSITRFTFNVRPYQVAPGPRRIFPATFIDLAKAAEIARGLGYDGRLTHARIGLGSPHWGLRFQGGRPGTAGIVLDGVTGKPVVHDMKEVMGDYNRQWDEAIAQIRARLKADKPGGGGDCPYGTNRTDSGFCQDPHWQVMCQGSGGKWENSSCN